LQKLKLRCTIKTEVIMAKLYFKYGVMGSSKTAQALMCRYNYIQQGFNVLLLKPAIDNRFENGSPKVVSRIGLEAECVKFGRDEDLILLLDREDQKRKVDVVIVDECQFATKKQIEQLKDIAYGCSIPVLCYGLLTNFRTELFEGSKRLMELADSVSEIKSVCKCGEKATVNARLLDGHVTIDGPEVQLGAEETYQSMCYGCFKKNLDGNETCL